TMLNDAHPVSDRKQGVMYFGEIAGMSLGDGFTDYRTRQLDGKERFDFVTFKYKVSFTKPTKLEVSAQQLQRIRERLDTMRIKYSCTEKKNEFGEVARATFQLTGPFPCQTVLRADYDKPGFVFEMMNVRRHGPAKMRLGVEELTDAVLDEFGTWVLGADDSFERFLKRG
ncbi:MAG: hypothetical protein ACREUO_03820, partial [Burkholderiales bacterium]